MAHVAACTDKGTRRKTNQDACCTQVADTKYGEVVMAIVCDGVGGLAGGELASSSVVYRFAQWFNDELPVLVARMGVGRPFDFGCVEAAWRQLLASLNTKIQAYGRTRGVCMGTTFTGVLVCGSHYVAGHVGDCRMYHITGHEAHQVTVDQTLLAKKLAEGELSPENVDEFPLGHVILQSVGTEDLLRPSFYEGACSPDDLLVLCCDGAYHKAEDVGVGTFFWHVDHRDEAALEQACRDVLRYDMNHGESDNLTIVCVSCDLRGPTYRVVTPTDADESRTLAYADERTLQIEPDDRDDA